MDALKRQGDIKLSVMLLLKDALVRSLLLGHSVI